MQHLGSTIVIHICPEMSYDVIVNAYYALPAKFRDNAEWVMPSRLVPEVKKIVDLVGNYLWQDMLLPKSAPRLLGKPVIIDESAKRIIFRGRKEVAKGEAMKDFPDKAKLHGIADILWSPSSDGCKVARQVKDLNFAAHILRKVADMQDEKPKVESLMSLPSKEEFRKLADRLSVFNSYGPRSDVVTQAVNVLYKVVDMQEVEEPKVESLHQAKTRLRKGRAQGCSDIATDLCAISLRQVDRLAEIMLRNLTMNVWCDMGEALRKERAVIKQMLEGCKG